MSTALLTATVLGILTKAAQRAGLVDRNPVSLARKPRRERKPLEVYPPAELSRVIEYARDHGTPALAFLAATGARVGEAAALEVADFDPRAGTVSITRTEVLHGGGTGPPKSPYSVRTIRVPAAALPQVRAAAKGRAGGLLFGSGITAVQWQWTVCRRALGLAPKGIHALRHSVASALVAAGMPIANVARDLGDSVETVVKTYIHPQPGADLADGMDGILGAVVCAQSGRGDRKRRNA